MSNKESQARRISLLHTMTGSTDPSPAESLYIFISSVIFGSKSDCSMRKKTENDTCQNIFSFYCFWGQLVVK